MGSRGRVEAWIRALLRNDEALVVGQAYAWAAGTAASVLGRAAHLDVAIEPATDGVGMFGSLVFSYAIGDAASAPTPAPRRMALVVRMLRR